MISRYRFIVTALFLGCLTLLLSSCVVTEPGSTQYRSKATGGRVNHAILAQCNGKNSKVVVDIADQKAFLLVNGTIAVKSPVSTARPGKRTPRGSFRISEKVRSGKVSTIYNVTMPYWMRLGGSPFGLHAGYLPGYPASAGCVRMPSKYAKIFYDNTRVGTRVTIYNSWSGG